MAEKRKEIVTIVSQERLAEDIYSMWLQTDEIASLAGAGQFVDLYCADGARLLPRPISICELDKAKGRLRLVYRVAGKGTDEFSRLKAGERLAVLGPLGNGFPLLEERAILIGGGIGIPPMLELARELPGQKTIVAGYRSGLFLYEDLREQAEVVIATEDGSAGTKGNVLDAIKAAGVEGEVIYACGPTPMLKAIKAYAAEKHIRCYLSLEERMACGIGACLACVCKSKEVDGHTNVRNKRVCKEGPVFAAEEVELS